MDDLQQKLVNNAALIIISRIAMLLASVALPFVGMMIKSGLDTMHQIELKVNGVRDQSFEITGTLKLIEQTQTSQQQLLADHEMRVRALESFNRMHQ